MTTEIACYSKVATNRKVIALTFDDGPHPSNTPELLRVLWCHQVKATFYILGAEAEKHPEVLKSVSEQGHEIGNHTYSHPYMTQISDTEKYQEVDRAEHAIKKVIGRKPLTLRPPYLDYDDSVLKTASTFGYPVINGYGTDDWAAPGTDHIVELIRKQVCNGAIIICHDGGGERSQTVEACAIVIPELITQGYEFVTISELLALTT